MDAGLLIVLLGTMTVTAYRPVPAQTDLSPTFTSIGDRTTRYGIAVSQDLLETGEIKYGDVLKVDGLGLRIVNDTMARRHTRSVDLLVLTREEEKRVGIRRCKIWRIRDHGYDQREETSKRNSSVQETKRARAVTRGNAAHYEGPK